MIPCYHSRICFLDTSFTSSLAAPGSKLIHSANIWAPFYETASAQHLRLICKQKDKNLCHHRTFKKTHTHYIKDFWDIVKNQSSFQDDILKRFLDLDIQRQVLFLTLTLAFSVSLCRIICIVVLVTNLYWVKIGHLSVPFILYHLAINTMLHNPDEKKIV